MFSEKPLIYTKPSYVDEKHTLSVLSRQTPRCWQAVHKPNSLVIEQYHLLLLIHPDLAASCRHGQLLPVILSKTEKNMKNIMLLL